LSGLAGSRFESGWVNSGAAGGAVAVAVADAVYPLRYRNSYFGLAGTLTFNA